MPGPASIAIYFRQLLLHLENSYYLSLASLRLVAAKAIKLSNLHLVLFTPTFTYTTFTYTISHSHLRFSGLFKFELDPQPIYFYAANCSALPFDLVVFGVLRICCHLRTLFLPLVKGKSFL